MKSILATFLVSCFLAGGVGSTHSQQFRGPAQVAGDRDFNDGRNDFVPDGNFSVVGYSQGRGARLLFPIWDRKNGGIKHLLAEGAIDQPVKRKVWIKPPAEFFENATRDDGNLWVVNTYLHKQGVLAIIHAEAVRGSGRPGDPGRSRIGLAWSSNGGETFRYLGEIVAAHQDPSSHNVQGGAYVVKDGYMYIYYHDVNGITAVRAPLRTVLDAAREGRVTPWHKYAGQAAGFVTPALGGEAVPIGVKGASHSDAACSAYTKKCYLVLTTMTWNRGKSTVVLYESADAVKWTHMKTLADEPATSDQVRGYLYATILNENGGDNSEVGRRFYIYSAKNHLDSDRGFYRWTVELK